jgi:L-ribulose-5-phosphate 3-epimerase UlaE
MSFMLLSHVLASLCLYITSKAINSYIHTPSGTPSVSYGSFFQVVSPSDIISMWLISMWCQQDREEQPPEVCNDQKTTSDIYKW